jgi:hypothetical protein
MIELPPTFIHQPPEGYSYEVTEHKRNVVAIWLRDHRKYSYTTDDVRTIWGFYNGKKREYYAPVNAKKAGSVVNISDTRPYTAMKIHYKGLQRFFKSN